MNSMILASFWEQYGLWIILIGMVALLLVYNLFNNKKLSEKINNLQSKLVPGAKVKTYSGIYGSIEKVTETTDGKVITLKLSENSFLDIDVNAIMSLDEKQTMEEVEMLERLNNVSNVETQDITQEGYTAKEKLEHPIEQEAEIVEKKEEKKSSKKTSKNSEK